MSEPAKRVASYDDEAVARAIGMLLKAEAPPPPSLSVDLRTWRRILDERASRQTRARRRWFSFVGAAAVAAGLLVTWKVANGPVSYTVDGKSMPPQVAVSGSSVPVQLDFSDGTKVKVLPAARAQVVATERRGARIRLERGALALSVKKKRSARWSVEAGPFAVDVTGTSFYVSWNKHDDALTVDLYEGSVVVRGPGDKKVAMTAPQRLTFDARTVGSRREHEAAARARRVRPAPAPRAVAAALPPPVAPREPLPLRAESAPSPARAQPWIESFRSGNYQRIVDDAEDRGLDRVLRTRTASELSTLADAALYVRRPQVAKRVWTGLRRRFPGSFEARQAAFRMGILSEDGVRDVTAARSWYMAYLDESPAGAFAAEALGRLMLLVQRSGSRDEAQRWAREYLERFPVGTYAHAARVIAERR